MRVPPLKHDAYFFCRRFCTILGRPIWALSNDFERRSWGRPLTTLPDGPALNGNPAEDEVEELKGCRRLENVIRVQPRESQLQQHRQVRCQVGARVHQRPEHSSQGPDRRWSLTGIGQKTTYV